MKKIFDISRIMSMESLADNDKYFQFNPEINREPVKIRKNRCNMTELGREYSNELQ